MYPSVDHILLILNLFIKFLFWCNFLQLQRSVFFFSYLDCFQFQKHYSFSHKNYKYKKLPCYRATLLFARGNYFWPKLKTVKVGDALSTIQNSSLYYHPSDLHLSLLVTMKSLSLLVTRSSFRITIRGMSTRLLHFIYTSFGRYICKSEQV